MIRTPTVLVLGAGASMPYGFPSGQGLKENIISFGAEVHKRIEHLPRCTQERFQEFQRELRYSSQSSVDAFLEHRPELVPLGKALIALVLIQREDTDRLFPKKDDWYQFLWQQMGTSLDEFHLNQLSIITFNYDRSLEHFLLTALMNSYGVPERQAAAKLKRIPIVHVYGQLGLLEWQAEEGAKAPIRPYDPEATAEAIATAANGIQILTGQAHSDKFREARDLVIKAKRVYFLGFSYNEVNMKRLDLPLQGSQYDTDERLIAGSCFGLTGVQRGIIMQKYRGLQLRDEHYVALAFLRHEEEFLRG